MVKLGQSGAYHMALLQRREIADMLLPRMRFSIIWTRILVLCCMRGGIIVAFLLMWVVASIPASAQRNTVSGYVEVDATGVRVVGAHVFLEESPTRGAVTNQDGFFSLVTDSDEFALVISHVSYVQLRINLDVVGDTTIVFQVVPTMVRLDGIEVQDTRIVDEGARMSTHHIPIAAVEALPALAGELDIQKTLQLLPGVQGGAEGRAGLYVRGGRHDQNLILLDGMPLYNPSHVFGFFGVFHPASIKDVEFIKGGFPARYGGRLSSVVNYSMKEGSTREFHGQGTIGLLTSNLAFEGPIVKNRASVMVAARRSYVDLIYRALQSPEDRFGMGFYDVSAKAQVRLSDKDNASLTVYGGQDNLYNEHDRLYRTNNNQRLVNPNITDQGRSGIGWGNRMASLRWGRVLNSRTYLTANVGIVHYEFESTSSHERSNINDGGIRTNDLRRTSVRDYVGKTAIDYVANSLLSVRGGLEAIQHRIDPGRETRTYVRTDSLANTHTFDGGESMTADTYAAYMESDWSFRSGTNVSIGLRASLYESGTFQDFALSPRLSISVPILENFMAMASWARTSQYLHQPASSAEVHPPEVWVPAHQGLPGQRGHQWAVGLKGRLPKQGFTASIEAFGKRMRGLPEYKTNGEFASAPPIDWPSVLASGWGRASGIEFLMRKEVGATKGWIAYTYSRSTRWFSEIEGGRHFPDTYDRLHDVSVAATYELSARIQLAAAWIYGSGYPATLPAGEYEAQSLVSYYGIQFDPTVILVDYGPANGSRLPPTHRLDLSLRFRKQFRRSTRTWTVGVHNAYNRRNPSYVFPSMNDGNRPVRLKQISYLMLIPNISYSRAF